MKKKQKKTVAACTVRPASAPAGIGGSRKFAVLSGALIAAAIALAIYLPALQNGFLSNWDDNRYILDNPHIQSLGARFFRWALLDYRTNLWHPVSWISHAVDYAIWGLNPLGHHLTNILLHAVNTALVVLVAARLITITRDGKDVPEGISTSPPPPGVLTASVVTGILFAIHPMHVESVAWVTERKDLLYALFYLLSVACYCRYVSAVPSAATVRGSILNRYYLATVFLFVLAVASKPMAVTLPFVLLVLDWYPLRRLGQRGNLLRIAVEKIPFFILSAMVSVITVLAQQGLGGLKSVSDATLSFRILLAIKSLVLYLLQVLFPVGLSPLYPYPRDHTLLRADYLVSLLVMAGITFVCIWYRRKRPVFLATLLVFVFSLLPVLGLMQAGVQARADRFMYLACLGPLLLVGLGAAEVWQRLNAKLQQRRVISVLALVCCCVLSVLTIRQIGVWKDAMTLWNEVIVREEPFEDLYLYRGEAYEKAGYADLALLDYDRAIAVAPRDCNAYVHRGTVLLNQGKLDAAIKAFDQAIAVDPEAADAYNNRGNAYRKKGDIGRALQEYDTAIAKQPTLYISYVNRASALVEKGEIHRAIEDLNTVLTLKPDLGTVYSSRAALNMAVGNVEKALADYNQACSLGQSDACNMGGESLLIPSLTPVRPN